MTMSIAEHFLLQDLKRRVEALEQASIASCESLRLANGRRKAEGAKLRELIRATGEARAKHVLQTLARDGVQPLPSIRTVQWHLAAVRKADGVAKNATLERAV